MNTSRFSTFASGLIVAASSLTATAQGAAAARDAANANLGEATPLLASGAMPRAA